MDKWKLFWVASDGEEDCFVVARNSLEAKYVDDIEKDSYSKVIFIMDILEPEKNLKIAKMLETRWRRRNNEICFDENCLPWPAWARGWLLKRLGAKTRNIEGGIEIRIGHFLVLDCYGFIFKRIYNLNDYFPINKQNDFLWLKENIYRMAGQCLFLNQEIEQKMIQIIDGTYDKRQQIIHEQSPETMFESDREILGEFERKLKKTKHSGIIEKIFLDFKLLRNYFTHRFCGLNKFDLEKPEGIMESNLFLKDYFDFSGYIKQVLVHLLVDDNGILRINKQGIVEKEYEFFCRKIYSYLHFTLVQYMPPQDYSEFRNKMKRNFDLKSKKGS